MHTPRVCIAETLGAWPILNAEIDETLCTTWTILLCIWQFGKYIICSKYHNLNTWQHASVVTRGFTLARLIYQHPNNIRICMTWSLYLLYFAKHAIMFLILKIEYWKLCFGYITNMTNKISASVVRSVYSSQKITYPNL